MKMRVADYLTDALYRAGGETVFLVTGGMIMHLTDAVLVHGEQKWISCHHEQAAVMAADAYGRYTQPARRRLRHRRPWRAQHADRRRGGVR